MLYHLYRSTYGPIQIHIENDKIINMTMKEEKFKSINIINKSYLCCSKIEKNLLNNTIKQLEEYFKGQRKEFELNIHLEGSDFVKRVYDAVINTKYGETYSYKQIAQIAGSPRAFRAVGTAMKNNPFAMIIPCHRVIKSNGEYGKYFNNDVLKKELIMFEKSNM